MSELSGADTQLKSIEKAAALLTPVGERILGDIDPRTLSIEEFHKSKDLLVHGTDVSFQLTKDIDYIDFVGPYSATIGSGFYTTDDRSNAEFYSRLRQGGTDQSIQPVLVEVLPFQARVLDLRAKEDLERNAPVPQEMVREFTDFIKEKYQTHFPEGLDPQTALKDHERTSLYMILNGIKSQLFEQLRENPDGVELRSMLCARKYGNSENGAPFLTEFMLSKGYDGLVYNEGGDHMDQKGSASFVFYNLEKVGTFEDWQDASTIRH